MAIIIVKARAIFQHVYPLSVNRAVGAIRLFNSNSITSRISGSDDLNVDDEMSVGPESYINKYQSFNPYSD